MQQQQPQQPAKAKAQHRLYSKHAQGGKLRTNIALTTFVMLLLMPRLPLLWEQQRPAPTHEESVRNSAAELKVRCRVSFVCKKTSATSRSRVKST